MDFIVFVCVRVDKLVSIESWSRFLPAPRVHSVHVMLLIVINERDLALYTCTEYKL